MSPESSLLDDRSIIGAGVVLLAAAVYANALANGLVWDDPIVLTRQLLAFRSLHDLIFLPRDIPQFSPDYYRPLTILSYLIDRAIAGTSPLMFHLSVVVYHVITTYLVFRFGLVLFGGRSMGTRMAGLGAAIFAIHPIHTESVAWGAGRSDVLACGFSLAAALAYFSERQTAAWRAVVAAALVLMAALAKETAVVFFVLLPLSDILLGRSAASPAPVVGRAERRRQSGVVAASRRTPVLHYVPLAAALMLYVLARESVLGSVLGPAGGLSIDVIPNIIGAIGHYTTKLVLPVWQSAYVSDLPTSPAALLAIGAMLAGAALGWLVAWRRGEREVVFLLVWMGCTLAPSLAIVIKIPAAPVAERYLYLPSVGYCVLLAYGIMRASAAIGSRNARTMLAAAVAVLLCVGAAATLRRNAVWRSNLTLWEDTAAKNLTDGLPMRSLATAYQQLGDTARAGEYFRLALQRRNDALGLFTINNNLGSLAMMEKKLDEAERYYRAALGGNPQAADVLFNLGLIGLTRAKNEDGTHDASWTHDQAVQARQLFEQAQQLSPLDPEIPVGLGQTLSVLGDSAGARIQFQRALQLGLPPETDAAVRKLLGELP
ncbi:MAG: hypothetical protein ACHQ9S_10935 [Candidatus Binatia bacterium]